MPSVPLMCRIYTLHGPSTIFSCLPLIELPNLNLSFQSVALSMELLDIVDSTAVSLFVVIMAEFTNRVFFNSTNITTMIETAVLSKILFVYLRPGLSKLRLWCKMTLIVHDLISNLVCSLFNQLSMTIILDPWGAGPKSTGWSWSTKNNISCAL